ncbi:hypothetical protein V6N13_036674 [Hibiscus sabdariffa]
MSWLCLLDCVLDVWLKNIKLLSGLMFEELEAAVAAIRAILSGDRLRNIELTQQELAKSVKDLDTRAKGAYGELKVEIDELKAQMNLVEVAMGNSVSLEKAPRTRVPEPQRYEGNRSAKELENFLFDIEQYFRATRIDTNEDKVVVAAMYLTGGAKLWWRSKFNNGVCSIKTWEVLKKELLNAFFPENVDYTARKKLRDLTHTGSVREYVREFATLLLDIRDMSEKDKLFAFLEGLKQWARLEVQRRQPHDVAAAMSATECLTDYSDNSAKRKAPVNGGNSSFVGNGGKVARTEKTPVWGNGRRPPPKEQISNRPSSGPGQSSAASRFPSGCFLCKGPHRMAECPHRGALSALEASRQDESPEKSLTDNSCEGIARMGSIRFLTALQSQLNSLKKEPERGLMYVDLIIGGKASRALVDTGATDTFISPKEAKRCGLTITKDVGQMKAVNSAASSIYGSAKKVVVKFMGREYGLHYHFHGRL